MKEFISNLNKKDRYMIFNMFYAYMVAGIYVIAIGSLLPFMREEYGLSYEVNGLLLSMHNIGNLVTGLLAGVVAIGMGLKSAYIVFSGLAAVGFIMTLITGNPVLLLIAMLFTGFGRGIVNNYNNLAISTLGKGKSAPNNMLHSCFSIGALLAPFMVVAFTKKSASGWRPAVITVALFLLSSMLLSFKMDMSSIDFDNTGKTTDKSFGFLKNKVFLYPAICMFFYQCVEASFMGWLVSYFISGGFVSESFSLALNAIMWIAIFAGRLTCAVMASKIHSPQLVRTLSIGMFVFSILFLLTNSFSMALISTIGIGLAESGMFGTIMACAGDIFPEYALSMGVFIAVCGAGSALWPTVIGFIAERAGMRAGMASVLIPAGFLVLFSFINNRFFAAKHGQDD